MDLNKAHIKPLGAALIAEKLNTGCPVLQHLNLNGNFIGDTGCGHVLSALKTGGASASLTHLELRKNNLTMINNSLVLLGNLANLQFLSLASNCLTLDNVRHIDLFVRALCPLVKLEKLNLSMNRIQDIGFAALREDVLPNLTVLKQLSLKRCFITPKSFSQWEKMLRQKDSPLQRINAGTCSNLTCYIFMGVLQRAISLHH